MTNALIRVRSIVLLPSQLLRFGDLSGYRSYHIHHSDVFSQSRRGFEPSVASRRLAQKHFPEDRDSVLCMAAYRIFSVTVGFSSGDELVRSYVSPTITALSTFTSQR